METNLDLLSELLWEIIESIDDLSSCVSSNIVFLTGGTFRSLGMFGEALMVEAPVGLTERSYGFIIIINYYLKFISNSFGS